MKRHGKIATDTSTHRLLFLMLPVIIPGLIICIFGILSISQQKKARELKLVETYRAELSGIRQKVEAKIQETAWQPFQQMKEIGTGAGDRGTVARVLKDILLKNPLVQYPFLLNARGDFIFPVSQQSEVVMPQSSFPVFANKATASLFKQGKAWEENERQFTRALSCYLNSLEGVENKKRGGEAGGLAVFNYIKNAIARCYFKLGKYIQALSYYREVLAGCTPTAGGRITDTPLYFEALRQAAICNRELGQEERATGYYLQLYEAILQLETTATADTFTFFKNESLDYLNRHVPNTSRIKERFQTAKFLDQLQELSDLDIALRWRYFETAYDGQNNGDREQGQLEQDQKNRNARRLAKLQEFYLTGDDKTLFYSFIKKMDLSARDFLPGVTIKNVTVPGWVGVIDIVFAALPMPRTQSSGPGDGVIFGFMISPEGLAAPEIAAILQAPVPGDRDIKIKLLDQRGSEPLDSSPGFFPLLRMPFTRFFKTKTLAMMAPYPDYFARLVRQDVYLSYTLMTAFMLILILGLVMIYKYHTREGELVRLKSEFTDNASHTLRTPLTRIRLLAEKLQLGWITDEAKKQEYFQTLLAETDRMNDMITTMLDFSKIEAGKMVYHLETASLAETVSQAVESYRTYITHLGFDLLVDIDTTIPVFPIDREAMLLVVVNLLQNAVKYSVQEKWIQLRLYRQGEHNRAILEVADHGMGMAEKELKHIFQRFYRAKDSHIQHVTGSGLGLYLVHHAVMAHQGEISVHSVLGKGSCFRIALPIAANTKKEAS